MAKITFHKENKKSLLDTIKFQLTYMSGDADGDEFVEIPLKFKFSEWKDHETELKMAIKKFQTISNLTDCNHKDYAEDIDLQEDEDVVEAIERLYSEEIASMFQEAPIDHTSQDRNAHLTDVILIGYDTNGVKHETYNLIN